MTYRLSQARVRADLAALGTIAAVARKHGVSRAVIERRAPEFNSGGRNFGIKNACRRAAFLFSIGMTLDEAASAAGVTPIAAVSAIRARAATHAGRRAMLAPFTPHVGAPDVRARTRSAPVRGPGAPLNAAGRAGAPRPLPGRVLMDVSSLTSPSPDAKRGLFFPRDRLRLQAVDRACVPRIFVCPSLHRSLLLPLPLGRRNAVPCSGSASAKKW